MVTVDRNMCMYCGACVGTCPTGALLLEETIVTWNEKVCTQCAVCERVCPVGAIDM